MACLCSLSDDQRASLCDVQVTDVQRSLRAQVALPQSWQAPPPTPFRVNLDPLGIPPKSVPSHAIVEALETG
eukprot:270259-Chlamydomonas_euryale.AAC.1